MNLELKQIGELLRAKREDLHLSLKEIESSTSIRFGYIEAIEMGRIYEFISGVYAIGFIKQYARFLGFDIERFVLEHPAVFQIPEQGHDFAYGIGTLESRANLGGGIKWIPNLLWSLGITGAFVLVYFIVKTSGLL